MADSEQLIAALDSRVQRRDDRRAFFRAAFGAAAVGAAAFAYADPALAQAAVPTERDVLNFALNLEYLEANFYYYAVFGTPIPSGSITGVFTSVPADTAADANGNRYNAGARAVNFKDPLVAQYAREIAADELAHVNFLRKQLSDAAVGQPAIDIGITPNGAFSSAARSANLIGASTAAQPTFFDPYASDENFLLGAFIFEDVGVTAYKGSAGLLSNKAYVDAAAGILATEAYHASIVRTVLDQKGIQTPSLNLRAATESISTARDGLDGTTTSAATQTSPQLYADDDQGIMPMSSADGDVSNIAPTDANGIAFGRTAGQVLNIVYLNKAAVTMGGFFPNGVNGAIKTSAASG